MVSNDRTGVISCADLGKSFDGKEVVRAVDLDIPAGSIVGFIGPSGCGKTTTVKLLTGLYKPTTGAAWIDGTRSTELTAAQRSRIGYLPQVPALFPELSLWENLSFHASIQGLRLRRRRWLHQLLDWVELDGDRNKRVSEASGGMQRRLALAATFVHDPPILFLDEPTAGIDPVLRAKFWERFREMRDEGRTMFVTTQYVGEASYCDVVGLLSEGELLMVDTPESLRRAAFEGEVIDVELARRVDESEMAPLAALDVVIGEPQEIAPRQWRIVVNDADAALELVRAALEGRDIPVIETKEHIVDYDEAFVRVIERSRQRRSGSEPARTDEPAEVTGDRA